MLGLLLNTGEWREWAVLNREETEVGEAKVRWNYEREGFWVMVRTWLMRRARGR